MLDVDYQRELNRLLDSLCTFIQLPEEWAEHYFQATGVQSPDFDDRRRFVRHRIRGKAILETLDTIPSFERPQHKHVVYTYDISRGGISFLHSHQLYPTDSCVLWLTSRKMPIEVVRCFYFNPRCYLIGAQPVGEGKLAAAGPPGAVSLGPGG